MTIQFTDAFAANLETDQAKNIRVTLEELCAAAVEISEICGRGPLEGALGATTGGENSDGDAQKALDVRADEIVTHALGQAPVAYYASEEQDDIVTLKAGEPLAVACDPLDGSSNIDTNVSIGTIFSIYPNAGGAKSSFFRLGSEQLAGGFFVYGPQTSLIVTAGDGVDMYILDRSDNVFKPVELKTPIAEDSKEFAVNASNLHHWQVPIRSYIEDCLRGTEGPLGRKYNMRWVGSLVADAGRILSRGGIFLYPADDRTGYGKGRLRLLYEANPVAFVMEQAGGLATDGLLRILGIELTDLHQRVPLIFGSPKPVQMVAQYHHQRHEKITAAPLFNERGLFQSK
ncbi:MAG TPA: class 1 fructose-bisphosphatase [Hellea balneolensis]|uniref:Fructose-1,6-bisphosphatase class 1 n=1 Tax=Hellea balneolensis TaxID=287478 RepID=A0A7C5LY89_9PROT|nr:class 1 fructose-bisphosphatase [Hellea balneolensis]